ncbi:MAG: hypothetical protein HC915_20800 [Anaerolineae bacterium]|nr:hypothetical protein [Anaerolineae bacterium]
MNHAYWIVAHALPGDAGAIEGFIHPLLGLEHLLAMFAVGLLSARIGGPAIWKMPAAFLSLMTVGGVIGFLAGQLSVIGYGVALSVLLLGLALAIVRPLPETLALVLVSILRSSMDMPMGKLSPAAGLRFSSWPMCWAL